MLPNDTLEYLESQNKRLSQINGDDLNDVFNRFQTLISMFNRLYTELPPILIARGQVISKADLKSDNKKATVFPILLLGTQPIVEALQRANLHGCINDFANFIRNGDFSICFNKNGTHDPQADMNLCAQLSSNSDQEKISGLLLFLYKVRNNTVHGQKHFSERQRDLLIPLANILVVLNGLLFAELNK